MGWKIKTIISVFLVTIIFVVTYTITGARMEENNIFGFRTESIVLGANQIMEDAVELNSSVKSLGSGDTITSSLTKIVAKYYIDSLYPIERVDENCFRTLPVNVTALNELTLTAKDSKVLQKGEIPYKINGIESKNLSYSVNNTVCHNMTIGIYSWGFNSSKVVITDVSEGVFNQTQDTDSVVHLASNDSKLLAYLPMDYTSTIPQDYSIYERTTDISASPTWTPNGLNKGAFILDNKPESINIDFVDVLFRASDEHDFSINLCFNLTYHGSSEYFPLISSSTGIFKVINNSGNQRQLRLDATGFTTGGILTSPSEALTVDAWHCAAVTYNGTNLSLYLDGTLVNSSIPTGNVSMGTGLRFSCFSAPSNCAEGTYDEFFVYNESLSEEFISTYHTDFIGFNHYIDGTYTAPVQNLSGNGTVRSVHNISWYSDEPAGTNISVILRTRTINYTELATYSQNGETQVGEVIAHYMMDDNSGQNLINSSYDCTVDNSKVTFTEQNLSGLGVAGTFDGIDNDGHSMDCTEALAQRMNGTKNFSIGAWLRHNGDCTAANAVVGTSDTFGTGWAEITDAAHEPRCGVKGSIRLDGTNDAEQFVGTSVGKIFPDIWYFVLWQYNGSDWCGFVDGAIDVCDTSMTNPYGYLSGGTDHTITGFVSVGFDDVAGGRSYFDGEINELFICAPMCNGSALYDKTKYLYTNWTTRDYTNPSIPAADSVNGTHVQAKFYYESNNTEIPPLLFNYNISYGDFSVVPPPAVDPCEPPSEGQWNQSVWCNITTDTQVYGDLNCSGKLNISATLNFTNNDYAFIMMWDTCERIVHPPFGRYGWNITE